MSRGSVRSRDAKKEEGSGKRDGSGPTDGRGESSGRRGRRRLDDPDRLIVRVVRVFLFLDDDGDCHGSASVSGVLYNSSTSSGA